MKLFFPLFMLICAASCSQNNTKLKNKEVVNIYAISKDSIFYCAGEKFEPENLIKGITKDSVFITTLIEMISDTNKIVLFKPLAGNSAGSGETMLSLMDILQKNDLGHITLALPDSAEIKYFNAISFLEYASTRPPETITVTAPTSVANDFPRDKPALFFLLTKDDKIFYKYDSTNQDKNFIQINPFTTEKIVQVISKLEKLYKVTFNENNVLVKGDGSVRYPVFKQLKEALKKKEIFKFKIVTTTE